MKKSVYIPKEHLPNVLKNGRGKAYTTIDIMKDETDPLRSYTLMMKDNKRLVVNGLQLVHQLSLMVVQPNI